MSSSGTTQITDTNTEDRQKRNKPEENRQLIKYHYDSHNQEHNALRSQSIRKGDY